MSQSAEGVGGGIIEGDGADARHAVPDPGPQPPGAVGGQHRLRRQGQLLSAAGDPQLHDASALEQGRELLGALHLGAVSGLDHVPHLEAAVRPRRQHAAAGLHLRQADDHHALGEQLDADGVTHRHQALRLQGRGPGPLLEPQQGGGAQKAAKKKSRAALPAPAASNHPYHHPFPKICCRFHSAALLLYVI